MDQLRSLMQSALAQRLAEHLRAEVAPVTNIPNLRTASVQDRLVGGLRLGTLAPRDLLDTLGLAREGLDYGAKALTGLGTLETQKIQQIDNPVLRNAANAGSFLLPGGPITTILALATEAGRDHLPSPVGPTDVQNASAAFDQAQGNVVSRLRQANEGFAQDSPLAAGIFNQLYNPLTYLTGGGTAEERALQQSGRISRGLNVDLNTVNSILYPEGHLIGKASSAILGPAVRGVLGPEVLGKILQYRYDLPAPPIPGVTADRAAMAAAPAEDRAAQLLAALFPETGPHLPPELGPAFPNQRGNLPLDQMIPGIGNGKPSGIGPLLPPLQDVPLPPELGPQLPLGGNVPPDQLIPGIGQTGNKGTGTGRGGRPGIGPVLSPADLLGAGRHGRRRTSWHGPPLPRRRPTRSG
jgi:hypothetical protein